MIYEANMLYFLTHNSESNSNIDLDEIMNCLGAALGIQTIYGIIKNSSELALATTAKQAIKLILKRYAGYVGVAVSIYSFGNCMDYW